MLVSNNNRTPSNTKDTTNHPLVCFNTAAIPSTPNKKKPARTSAKSRLVLRSVNLLESSFSAAAPALYSILDCPDRDLELALPPPDVSEQTCKVFAASVLGNTLSTVVGEMLVPCGPEAGFAPFCVGPSSNSVTAGLDGGTDEAILQGI